MQVKNTPSVIHFQGFAKFKGKPQAATRTADKIKENFESPFVFWDKKIKKEKTYYIITGKHKDKFISLMRDIDMFELKENVEKYMKEKAEKISLKELHKQIKNGKLKI